MSLNSIQQAVYDEFGALYPGQIADFGSAQNAEIRSYINDTPVFPGIAVVKYADIPSNNSNVRTPYTVGLPTLSSVADDVVGLVIRTESFITDDATNKPFRPANSMISIAELGSGVIIGATTTVDITHKDDVYVSIDDSQAPFIPKTEFTNIEGPGVVQLVGSSWYGSAVANTVARIKA